MISKTNLVFVAAIIAIGFGIYGCSNSNHDMSEMNQSIPAVSDVKDTPGMDHSRHPVTTGNSQELPIMAGMEGISELTREEQASALMQHMCPVSGEMIGSMGKPIKITVKEQGIWLCCDGCTQKLLANPDEYLAKLHDNHGAMKKME